MRAWINRWRRRVAHAINFRVVFGERSQGRYLPYTRISPSTCIEYEHNLVLGDHVFIGPFNFIEASAGITIEEGVQITNFVSLTTHSSHRAQRLLGAEFTTWTGGDGQTGDRPGWIGGPIHIGAYSFIGPHTLIEAGTRVGRGCIVCAGSQLRGHYTDFAVIEGRPARVVGDSRTGDAKLLELYPELKPFHEAWAGPLPAPEPGAPSRARPRR
jgi:acetyltransferase-like isoleucine patch superfamily enzyme